MTRRALWALFAGQAAAQVKVKPDPGANLCIGPIGLPCQPVEPSNVSNGYIDKNGRWRCPEGKVCYHPTGVEAIEAVEKLREEVQFLKKLLARAQKQIDHQQKAMEYQDQMDKEFIKGLEGLERRVTKLEGR